jgi:hypothetical protein
MRTLLAGFQGQGVVGLENQGLKRWGLGLKAGKVYQGHLRARAERLVELTVGLESRDGARSYARAERLGGSDGAPRFAYVGPRRVRRTTVGQRPNQREEAPTWGLVGERW